MLNVMILYLGESYQIFKMLILGEQIHCLFLNRCFYLSKLVGNYATHNPEEGEECAKIIQEFKNLPLQLLDQCNDAREAQMILEDQTGSSKFFRDPNKMLLPRLHLAIEHNNRGISLPIQYFLLL